MLISGEALHQVLVKVRRSEITAIEISTTMSKDLYQSMQIGYIWQHIAWTNIHPYR